MAGGCFMKTACKVACLGLSVILLFISVPACKSSPKATGVVGAYVVGEYPSDTTVAGDSLWVLYGGDSLARVAISDGSVLGRYVVGDSTGALCSADGYVWVSLPWSGDLVKLKQSSGEIEATYNIGNFPKSLCVVGDTIWVGSRSGYVTRLKASSGEILSSEKLANSTSDLCLIGGYVWVGLAGSKLAKMSVGDGKVVAIYSLSAYPSCLTAVGSDLWAGLSNSSLVVIDTTDGSVKTVYGVGSRPTTLCTVGDYVWAGTYTYTSNVLKFEASGAIRESYNIGLEHYGISYDGSSVWVSDWNGTKVYKIAAA